LEIGKFAQGGGRGRESEWKGGMRAGQLCLVAGPVKTGGRKRKPRSIRLPEAICSL